VSSPETSSDPALPQALQDDKTLPAVVYALTLAGLVTGGLTSVIAVVLAYVSRKGAPEWLQSHYLFQIRTFWLSLLAGVIGGALSFIGIGLLILLALGVWIAVRSIVGLSKLLKGEAYPTPNSWMI
jgi:uncharacterized membrane protein